MYEFWFDHIKERYNDKVQLHYINTISFIIDIKTSDFYGDISKDLKKDLILVIMKSKDLSQYTKMKTFLVWRMKDRVQKK